MAKRGLLECATPGCDWYIVVEDYREDRGVVTGLGHRTETGHAVAHMTYSRLEADRANNEIWKGASHG